MSYIVTQISRPMGELTAEDYSAHLNHHAAQGADFVQAIPQGIGRTILIFLQDKPKYENSSHDDIIWLTDLINNSDKGD